MADRDNNVYKAKLAEQAERYDEMVEAMKRVAQLDVEMKPEERNLFSVGYKNIIGTRRASWRVISSIEMKEEQKGEEASSLRLKVVKEFREQIEKELKDICKDIFDVLEKHIIPSATELESKVFFSKMKGDYYRYLAEFTKDDEKAKASEEALSAYEKAFNSALEDGGLPTTHPIRLGMALNFSVFYYEILDDREKAVKLAKSAFDDAVSELDSLSEDSYKDSTLIMQLLRDNLTLWTSDIAGEGEDDEKGPDNAE